MEPKSTRLDRTWGGRRVLVTGGAGFIGRHLVHALQEAGAQVDLVLRQHGSGPVCRRTYIGDLCEASFIAGVVADARPEAVFHLAASRARSLSPEAFAQTISNNLIGSLNLLEALSHSKGLERVVMLGTAEEYGRSPVPFRESVRESPVSAYSLSKLSTTHLAQMMAHTQGLPVTVLRPSVAYGPGQQEDMFLPALVCALLRREPFAMTAGEQTRDLIHIDDLVTALGSAGLCKAAEGEVINIGSGCAIRIADLVDMVENMTQSSGLAQRGAVAYRPGEAMQYQLDVSKAARLLGWHPQTSLAQGLQQTIDWYRTHRA
jgi:UDP-glucose 4-epimerase